jgi:hypothetical protein
VNGISQKYKLYYYTDKQLKTMVRKAYRGLLNKLPIIGKYISKRRVDKLFDAIVKEVNQNLVNTYIETFANIEDISKLGMPMPKNPDINDMFRENEDYTKIDKSKINYKK